MPSFTSHLDLSPASFPLLPAWMFPKRLTLGSYVTTAWISRGGGGWGGGYNGFLVRSVLMVKNYSLHDDRLSVLSLCAHVHDIYCL